MKNTILKGTLLLTAAGFLTRLLGFYYRICLADTLGAEYLGIYQLIFPVFGICYSLFASGIQTAVSKLTAEAGVRQNTAFLSCLLKKAILLSFCVAFALSLIVFFFSGPLAAYVLLEPRASSCLKILALDFPFCAVTACINGYYIGQKRTKVPAFTQLLEQLVRIGSVLFLVTLPSFLTPEKRCMAAVIGLVTGETASMLFNCISYRLHVRKQHSRTRSCSTAAVTVKLLTLSVPLSLNRLIINLLHSTESVFVPSMLRLSGLSASEALSLFGVLNGMALPFILFPSAIPNALSTLLMPAVSETVEVKNGARLRGYIDAAYKYSLLIGLFSTAIFWFFGHEIGTAVFHDSRAGEYLKILSPLCSLLYLSTTLSGVLTGLGKPALTFYNTIAGMLVRLVFVVFVIPKSGIYGYLIGLLVSQLVITVSDLVMVTRISGYFPRLSEWLVLPGIFAFLSAFFCNYVFSWIKEETQLSPLLSLFCLCGLCCASYSVFLLLTKTVKKKEFHMR